MNEFIRRDAKGMPIEPVTIRATITLDDKGCIGKVKMRDASGDHWTVKQGQSLDPEEPNYWMLVDEKEDNKPRHKIAITEIFG